MPLPVSTGYELSSQQRLFFMHGKERAVASIAVLLEGKLDHGKLHQSLEKLGGRHEILRTTFQRRTGMRFPFQVVREQLVFSWEERRLDGISSAEQQSAINGCLSDPVQLDPENGPVLGARLLTFGESHAVLILSCSALCVDDQSLSVLLHDLAALYAGEELPNDVIQYADYSEWQSELLSAGDDQALAAENFWSDYDQVPPLRIPFEGKASRGQTSGEYAVHQVNLENLNLSSEFLFAAWQSFLGRIAGRQEFAVGYLSDGRNHEEFRNAVGLFCRTLPVPARSELHGSFEDARTRSKNAVCAALEWEDYYAADRVSNLGGLGYAEFKPVKLSFYGIQLSEVSRQVPAPGVHLRLGCAIGDAGTQAALEYDAELFAPETTAQLAERFARLVSTAGNEPQMQVYRLPIMGEAERQKILVEFNRTTAEYPKDRCLHQLFENQAAQSPDRPALRFGDRALTYAEVNRESNRIAHVLRQNRVGAAVSVALCMERSVDMIIALLGVLKAGGYYVPLVPDNPKARLAHQLAETGAPVVLTHAAHADRLPEFAGKVIRLDRDHQLFDVAPDSNPDVQVAPDSLAYVIYTSGSTGVPKGVGVRHFNLVNYSHFICQRLTAGSHPAGLHFATVSTISADLGNTCIFPSLISGGCLHVIDYETAVSPELFSEYVARHPIDVLKITPSHLSSLLNGVPDSSVLPEKYLILGGEATSWDLAERIGRAKKCALLNHYGPTEATVGCCTFRADNEVNCWDAATLPIGKPIANAEIYILDGHMEPVPIGVAGELYVGGSGVARGYLNQPNQTAEHFLQNPFSNDPDARLYRTGDLARFLPDGNVEFLGRIDAQVKIRGFRVEPAEIESVLRKHPHVAAVAVVAYESDSAEKQLAAYVVSRNQIRKHDLRSFVLQQLPDYMVPSAFISIESIPLTANGKIDARALPNPQEHSLPRENVVPRNADEEKLALIWQEVLKRDAIGVTDNFFELGGHSLLATQIISRIRNGFRVQMPLHSFLQNPTIAALAKQLKDCPAIESEQEEMARLLRELEGISDEEAERLLAPEMRRDVKASGN